MTRAAVISTYPSEAGPLGGVSRYTESLVTALEECGQPVTVLAQRTPPPSGRHARPVWLPGPLLLPTVHHALSSGGFDVVHIQHEPFLYGKRSGALGALALPFVVRNHRLRCLLTLHAVPFPALLLDRTPDTRSVRLMSAGFFRAIRRVAGAVDTFIVHDSAQADALTAQAGIAPHKVATIPQGGRLADVDDGSPPPARPFTLGTYGFLAPYKDPGFLLDEFVRLRRRLPEAQLLFSLSRHPRRRDKRTEGTYDQLMARAAALAGVTTYGHLSDQELGDLLTRCDLIVNPYRYAVSTSAVLAQATGAGVPVLVLAESGDASRIPGWSFEYRPGSLAAALERQAAQLPTMRRQAVELAGSKRWAHVAELHRAEYERHS